ncbi:MAG: AI-2E family transporter [Chloroflexota bacterium]
MVSRLLESEGRWIHALLVLSTVTVALVLLNLVSGYLQFFSDVLMILFVAWLFAFILSPVVGGIVRRLPALPRIVVVVLVYGALFLILSGVIIFFAAQLANSLANVIDAVQQKEFAANLASQLEPWRKQLESFGIKLDLTGFSTSFALAAKNFLETNNDLVKQITSLVGGILGTTFGMIGNLLLIVFLSLFIVIDKEPILAFANRLVPPRYAEEAKLFETSVASSFGGFLRGQLIQGLVYGAFAAVGSILLGIPAWPATTVLVVILQFIPFFGPFFSWAPPIVAALLGNQALMAPNALIWISVIMAVGWFITMNIVQPRVMATSVGIHPVVVLVSVIIGVKVYGAMGAIFAVPVAAVISAFFFHFLQRSATGSRDVASRAARRVEERAGRKVRVPTPPAPGAAPDGEAPSEAAGRPAGGRPAA